MQGNDGTLLVTVKTLMFGGSQLANILISANYEPLTLNETRRDVEKNVCILESTKNKQLDMNQSG